eukprot:SM000004S14888  [mRNA]  locus=s4:1617:3152:- [translate_table: standard]
MVFLIALQEAGYEDFVSPVRHSFYCNGTRDDVLADAPRRLIPLEDGVRDYWDKKRTLQHDCDSIIRKHTLSGPFGNMTWTYFETYQMEHEDLQDWKYVLWPALFEYILSTSDVVILNLGIHYNVPQTRHLRKHLQYLAAKLGQFNQQKGKLGFFRETLPQHFASSDGSGTYQSVFINVQPLEVVSTCYAVPNLELQVCSRGLHSQGWS